MKFLITGLESLSRRIFGIGPLAYKGALSNRSFDSMSATLIWMVRGLQRVYPEFFVAGKVLEIGSGKYLSHPLGLRMLGASRVTSIDLFEQFNRKAAQVSFRQNVMAKKLFAGEINSRKYYEHLKEIDETNFELSSLADYGVEYIAPLDILNYNPQEHFDLVTSYTTLEHVPPRDVSSLLTKSISLLREGGHFCHFIDLEDHKNPQKNPFGFLIESEWSDFDCFTRGNRLRAHDWRKILDDLTDIQYSFVFVLERNDAPMPSPFDWSSDNRVTGILAVGKRL